MRFYFRSSPRNSLIRGALTLVLGVLFITMPDLTLKTAIMSVGGMILINGILSLIFSLIQRRQSTGAIFAPAGIFTILWGLVFLIYPLMIVKLFGFFFGLFFFFLGLVQLFGALNSITKSLWGWVYLFFSLLMITGGIYLWVHPLESAEKVLPFFGAILLFYGILELLSALKKKPAATNSGSPDDVIDTTYEEL